MKEAPQISCLSPLCGYLIHRVRRANVSFLDWAFSEMNGQLGWRAALLISDWVKSLIFVCGGLVVVSFMLLMIFLAVRNASKDRSDSSSE